MNGLSLLNGNYNEEESANSFAQALQEWRNQNKAAKISPENPSVTCTGMKDKNVITHEKYSCCMTHGLSMYETQF